MGPVTDGATQHTQATPLRVKSTLLGGHSRPGQRAASLWPSGARLCPAAGWPAPFSCLAEPLHGQVLLLPHPAWTSPPQLPRPLQCPLCAPPLSLFAQHLASATWGTPDSCSYLPRGCPTPRQKPTKVPTEQPKAPVWHPRPRPHMGTASSRRGLTRGTGRLSSGEASQSQSPGRAVEVGALRTYILDVVEAERGAPPRVLEGLRGEGLVVAMDETAKEEETLGWAQETLVRDPQTGRGQGPTDDWQGSLGCSAPAFCPMASRGRRGSLELAEDVGIFGGDAGCLQDGHTEGEGAAQAQVVQGGVQGPIQGSFLRAIQEEAFRRHGCWGPRTGGMWRDPRGLESGVGGGAHVVSSGGKVSQPPRSQWVGAASQHPRPRAGGAPT